MQIAAERNGILASDPYRTRLRHCWQFCRKLRYKRNRGSLLLAGQELLLDSCRYPADPAAYPGIRRARRELRINAAQQSLDDPAIAGGTVLHRSQRMESLFWCIAQLPASRSVSGTCVARIHFFHNSHGKVDLPRVLQTAEITACERGFRKISGQLHHFWFTPLWMACILL